MTLQELIECYITYTPDELRRLLSATDAAQGQGWLEAATLRTAVLLLYGTGLRAHEAVALNCADVDLARSLLAVRQTKFYKKARPVPFGQPLARVLSAHAARRRPCGSAPDGQAPFFTLRTGSRVTRGALENSFRRARERADVRRSPGARYQPRLHDLRHTFAVHRLMSWYRQGADVQRLLPQLSVYLGHVCLASTQVYLSMTPELLQEAGTRFEKCAWEGRHDG
jgi:integrase